VEEDIGKEVRKKEHQSGSLNSWKILFGFSIFFFSFLL
jgi:hypothetical protein